MAAYNAWMNAKVLECAATLPAQALAADRKAFFGSILGTLNHLLVGDTIWLQRFVGHAAPYPELDPIRQLPAPGALDAQLFADFDALRRHRSWLDARIVEWTEFITEADLDHNITYTNTKGITFERNFFALLMHFFNHQTHHRGQITTLLAQVGVDVGVTDLLALIPDSASA
jgi:uncharacterized damage-inducible protein DinB